MDILKKILYLKLNKNVNWKYYNMEKEFNFDDSEIIINRI